MKKMALPLPSTHSRHFHLKSFSDSKKLIALLISMLSLAVFFTACSKNQIPNGTYVPHEETARAHFSAMEEYVDSDDLEAQIEFFMESFTLRIAGDKFIYGTSEYIYTLNSDGTVTFSGDEIADDTFTYSDGKLIMSYSGLVIEMIKTV